MTPDPEPRDLANRSGTASHGDGAVPGSPLRPGAGPGRRGVSPAHRRARRVALQRLAATTIVACVAFALVALSLSGAFVVSHADEGRPRITLPRSRAIASGLPASDGSPAASPNTAVLVPPPGAAGAPAAPGQPDPSIAPPAAGTSVTWVTVVDDNFGRLDTIPSHWTLYNGPYHSGKENCAEPSHDVVSGGVLHLLLSHEASGACGAGWYSGGLALMSLGSVDQQVTVRFRILDQGASGHHIIPMRWPDATGAAYAEQDYCESDSLDACSSFLHYGTGLEQVYHTYHVDLSQWHTFRFQRIGYTITAWVDDMTHPAWTYQGTATTLPPVPAHVVLQQECHPQGCPSGTTGLEDIQIAWITVQTAG